MTPLETADALAKPISKIGSLFMFDAATYVTANALGFEGLDFYVTGRAGVIGNGDASVAVAALGFFGADSVRTLWDQGAGVMEPTKAAEHFAAACDSWGETHLTANVDYAELAELAGRVVDAAPIAGLPIFAGWRAFEVPDDPSAAAAHHINGLRELRGGLHLIAVLAAGIDPLRAVLSSGGEANASLLGHQEPFPTDLPSDEQRGEVERVTSTLIAPAFEVLDSDERGRLVDLVTQTKEALASA